ncbi:hypothetical protein AMECASPLE_035481 [Ameca splendens]|uniref:Uncharacterized protein n=1 Tax=Ameca splendens TaxID=208324 RepID=A0ABV0Z5P9_9TELE
MFGVYLLLDSETYPHSCPASIFQSTPAFPVSAEEKHLHSMMLPSLLVEIFPKRFAAVLAAEIDLNQSAKRQMHSTLLRFLLVKDFENHVPFFFISQLCATTFKPI